VRTLLTLLDHAAWADDRARAAVATLDPASAECAQATRLYAHLAAAEHVWSARLQGHAPRHPVWPELSLEAASALAVESLEAMRALAAGDPGWLDGEVEYRTTTGQAFRDRVVDVLTHVVLHGSYHRGQIALLARQGGGAPPATDYIVFVRGPAR
jgi:uncharacterized damage-inducible protein DinB